MRSIHTQILLAVATNLLLIASLTIPALSDTIIYTYDDLNRVAAVEYGDGSKVIYTYDENGNRLKRVSGKKINTITSSASAGGTITPLGAVTVNLGNDQAYTMTPNACYHVADVTVDNVSQGAVPIYSFTNVFADHTIAASFGLNTPVVIARATPVYFATLQAAYDAAVNGDVIMVQSTFSGGLITNRNIAVTINGGYNCDFTSNQGVTTLTSITYSNSSSGSITFNNVDIKYN